MASLIILIGIYGALLIICLLSSYRNAMFTPQFAYLSGFFAQAVFAINYVEKWDLQLALPTFLVLSGGAILFVVVSLLGQRLFRLDFGIGNRELKSDWGIDDSYRHESNSEWRIENWKLLLFFAFQIATIILYVIYLSRFDAGSLSVAMYYYRHTKAFTSIEIKDVSILLSQMRTLSMAFGYMCGYILMHSIVYKGGSNKTMLVVNIVLSAIIGCLLGARSSLVSLGVSIVVLYVVFKERLTKRKYKMPLKLILILLLACIVVVAIFPTLARMMGRNLSMSFWDYLAEYLSAEIKNLDTRIRRGNFGTDITNNQTFFVAIDWLSEKGIFPSSWAHKRDWRFYSVNGFNLGNVSTCYCAYVYDAGYIGVVVFTAIMASIGQWIYMKAVRERHKTSWIDKSVLVYSYLYFDFLFSFFSNKFYEDFFSPRFLYYLIWWSLLKWFIEKVHLRLPIRRTSYALCATKC